MQEKIIHSPEELQIINHYANEMINEIIDNIFINKDYFINNNLNDIFNFSNKITENNSIFINENYFKIIRINNEFNLIAVKNCRQLSGALCGFHTLFNLKNFLNFYLNYKKSCNDYQTKSENTIHDINLALYYMNKILNRSK